MGRGPKDLGRSFVTYTAYNSKVLPGKTLFTVCDFLEKNCRDDLHIEGIAALLSSPELTSTKISAEEKAEELQQEQLKSGCS